MYVNVVEVDHLPYGQRMVWHSDLNTLSVLSSLAPAERDEALCELQRQFRLSVLAEAVA